MRKAKALVIMVVFFLAVATSLSAAPIVIKLGHVEPENRSTHKATVEFKNYVEAQSGGRLSVEIFPNGQLGGDRQMTEAVALGVLQMTIPATSVLTTYNAKFGVLDLPFVFNDEKAAFAALDGDLGNTLNALLLPVGLRNLGYGYNGARHMSNNLRPITQPADLKGIKMRVMESPTFIDLFRLLGANPTPMAFGEVFTGLQQKTVDAQENSASLVFTMKFNEVQKFYSLTGHVQGILAYIINERFYKGLSADLQKIVSDGTRMFLVEKQRQYEVADTSVFLKRLADGGMTINEITPANHQKFVDLLQPMYAKFARANGQDILDLIAKYNK